MESRAVGQQRARLAKINTFGLVCLHDLTCDKGINGGPTAISAALVPGRILREEALSLPFDAARNSCVSVPKDSPTEGDLGPICTSVNGGGLGKRGELDGDAPPAAMVKMKKN